MSEPFTFPDHDEERFRQDCDLLEELLRVDPLAHVAWLRAFSGIESRPPAPADQATWTEDSILAAAKHGFFYASREGLITSAMLRRLARDPDLLTEFAARMRTGLVFQPFGPGDAGRSRESVARAASDFLSQLEEACQSAPDRESPPYLEIQRSEPLQVFTGFWTTEGQGPACRFEVPITGDAVLTLRWSSRTMGKLAVRLTETGDVAIPARTGVFLAFTGVDRAEGAPHAVRPPIAIETEARKLILLIRPVSQKQTLVGQAPRRDRRWWLMRVLPAAAAAAIVLAAVPFLRPGSSLPLTMEVAGAFDKQHLFDGSQSGPRGKPGNSDEFYVGLRVSDHAYVHLLVVSRSGALQLRPVHPNGDFALEAQANMPYALGGYPLADPHDPENVTAFFIVIASRRPLTDELARLPYERVDSGDLRRSVATLQENIRSDFSCIVGLVPVETNQDHR